MDNILELCLKGILLVMCILNCGLLITMIIRTIKEFKADKAYNKLRAQNLIEMENFFKQRLLAIEKEDDGEEHERQNSKQTSDKE